MLLSVVTFMCDQTVYYVVDFAVEIAISLLLLPYNAACGTLTIAATSRWPFALGRADPEPTGHHRSAHLEPLKP